MDITSLETLLTGAFKYCGQDSAKYEGECGAAHTGRQPTTHTHIHSQAVEVVQKLAGAGSSSFKNV